MQCPAVNLMISPSKTRPRKVRDAALVTRLVWWRAGNACDSAAGDAFLIPAARCSSLYPAAASPSCLITSPPCPTATHYIKRLHCLFTAASVRPIRGSSFVLVDAHSMLWHSLPYGLDVYWGPPADLGNKVFRRANIWPQVAPKWWRIRSGWWIACYWMLAFVSWYCKVHIVLVQITSDTVFYLSTTHRLPHEDRSTWFKISPLLISFLMMFWQIPVQAPLFLIICSHLRSVPWKWSTNSLEN